jgi:hypothetical protein
MHFVHPINLPRGYLALVRYVVQFVATMALLFRARPAVVLVQSPPHLAVLCAYLYQRLTGAPYLTDAHSAALLSPWWTRPRWLNSLLARGAIATVVTNEHLGGIVTGWQGRAFVMRDVPSDFGPATGGATPKTFTVTVVNTYAPDEPLSEVLQAARLEPSVQFFVTGRTPGHAQPALARAPENVRFTDYLPNDEYYRLLASSHAVMCLTTRDYTMQRGACEAVALGRPIITSNWPLLKEYFSQGTVHVDNSANSIAEGVRLMIEEYARLETEILSLRMKFRQQVETDLRRLERLVEDELQRRRR